MNNLPENTIQNKELFYTIEVLDEAIDKQRQVQFTYNVYGIDKKMHPKREEKYIVNPYQMAATNGRYYLICNYDKYDNISHYRIDRITDIEILPTSCKPKEEVKDIKYGLICQNIWLNISICLREKCSSSFRSKSIFGY